MANISSRSDSDFGPSFGGKSARSFDFTLLFEDSILTVVPASIFLVAACIRAVWLHNSPNKVSSSLSRQTKLAFLSAFVAVQLSILLLRATNAGSRSKASIPAASLDFVAACALIILSSFEHSRSVAPSTVIGLYLLITLPFDIARVRTFYLMESALATSIANLLSLSLAIKCAVLVSEAVEKRTILLSPYRHLPPESTSGVYSRAVFWWLNPLLLTGFNKFLDGSDLYELDHTLSSRRIQTLFQSKWSSVRAPKRYSLIWITCRTLMWQLLLSAVPRVLFSGVKFAQPFLIQETIGYVSSGTVSKPQSTGLGLVGAFALVYTTMAILQASYQHLLNRCLTQIRAGLITLIYTKTIDLSITALDESAALTLMSADVQRIVEALGLFHETWASAIEVAVAMYLLYRQLGIACIGPAAVFVCAVALTFAITRIISRSQKRWVEAIQKRVSFTSRVLSTMRSIKLLGISSVAQHLTQGLRMDEIKASSSYRKVIIARSAATNSTSVFAPFVTFLVYVFLARKSGKPLDIAGSFSILSLLALVELPLAILLYSLPEMVASAACFERIQRYLLSPSRQDHRLSLNNVYDSDQFRNTVSRTGNEASDVEMRVLPKMSRSAGDDAISLKECSFGWQPDRPVVKNIDLTIKAGNFVMIIGPVGCGKSSLLKGMLGETPSTSGFVYLKNKRIAFADQEPWIQNTTIGAAIRGTTDHPMNDENWYQEIISCCGLAEDLRNLPLGDETTIGTAGISLSGGQKQRLALARAVYSKEDILMIDDVFSGLDNDTEELIFRKLFGKTGPLRTRRTTVILVTHAVHRLTYADHIISLDQNGEITEQGSYENLRNGSGYVHRLDIRFKQEQVSTDEQVAVDVVAAPKIASADDGMVDNLRRLTGEWKAYAFYFSSSGWISSGLSIIWALIFVLAGKAPGLLVHYFGSSGLEGGRTTLFIALFGGFTFVMESALIVFIWQIYLVMIPRGSKNLHLRLLETTLRAPLSFFTKTDSSTTLNRFSQDLTLIDNDLPNNYLDVCFSLSQSVVLTAMMAVTSSYFIATIPLFGTAIYAVQKYYLRTSRQIRLLDLEAKAPVFAHFSETLSGLATIRSFGWANEFTSKNIELLDTSQRPFYLLYCIQRWLAVVLDLMVAALITILMAIIVAKRDSINPGLVGIGLLNALNFSATLAQLVRGWTQMETSIGAISRISDFVNETESEVKPQENILPPLEWPAQGRLQISNFAASYSADSELVLDNVTISIRPGEKFGICGRSGSGKSSMLASLLHLLEFRNGAIIIDDQDISFVQRETLRQRINVIPQEPFWISTKSVRFNMDLWSAESDSSTPTQETDTALISALSRCQIWHVFQAKGGLDATMSADFLSQGQRQLFCLARALVRKSKIIILDEVSANVDIHTDNVMQEIIRTEFAGCTIIAVAHRLNTIVDFDRVAVLMRGKVVECDDPAVLLRREGSKFKELYEL